jgi:fumarylacetoacetase
MNDVNHTHDTTLKSWVKSANNESEFPIQNLPFGIFRRKNTTEQYRAGVAIGECVVDMQALYKKNILSGNAKTGCKALTETTLNSFMSMGNKVATEFRSALSTILKEDSTHQSIVTDCLISQDEIEMHIPFKIGDYTDFYTSIHHATSVGKLFRPDQPLLPNYKWIPIAYHGRASTIGLSDGYVTRPIGQIKSIENSPPVVGHTQKLDYEVELGIIVGKHSQHTIPVPLKQAQEHIFGVCLLNDWSARDIQAWEYQPLGPFLSKNFMSSISPWVVTLEALAPYSTSMPNSTKNTKTLSYLHSEENAQHGAFDIKLEAYIRTEKMRKNNQTAYKLSQTSFKHAYWSMAQMLAHHTLSGCNMNSGDLLGSGTQSGPTPEEAGSLLELSEGGKHPIQLPNEENRTFLLDGDELEIRGFCQNNQGPKIGLGSVTAIVSSSFSTKDKNNNLGSS